MIQSPGPHYIRHCAAESPFKPVSAQIELLKNMQTRDGRCLKNSRQLCYDVPLLHRHTHRHPNNKRITSMMKITEKITSIQEEITENYKTRAIQFEYLLLELLEETDLF